MALEVRADHFAREKRKPVPPKLATGLDERLLLGRLRRQLLSHATGKVLDVTCGHGVNFRHYPAHCRVTAIDLDPGSISVARQTATDLKLDFETRTMNAEHMEYPDGLFDTVVSSVALCSFADPIAALREMSRVCKPDGTILLLEHGRSSFPSWAAWQDRQERRRGPHDGCHPNREPLDLVKLAGLRPYLSKRMFFGVIHMIVAQPTQ